MTNLDSYDDLDTSCASYTDRSMGPKTFDDKDGLIRKTEDRVANDLFKILDSILQKEVFSELIDIVTADDIFYNFRGQASSYLKRPVGGKIKI